MLNPVFEILPEAIDTQQINLFLEVNSEGLSYFFENHENKKIEGLTVLHCNKNTLGYSISDDLKKVFNEQKLFQKIFKNVFVIYAYDESILTPGQFYNPDMNAEMLKMVYGDLNEGTILSDIISGIDVYNVYRIPSNVHAVFISHFPLAAFAHHYTIIIKQLLTENNLLQVIFYKSNIVAALLKEGKLQIVQSFHYTTAEDVVYHLLNLCTQFEIQNIPVQLNGFIEKDSALFKEIQKYFLNITFKDLSHHYIYAEKIKEYPSHFFSHTFSAASCV